jgi:hypothetical protein
LKKQMFQAARLSFFRPSLVRRSFLLSTRSSTPLAPRLRSMLVGSLAFSTISAFPPLNTVAEEMTETLCEIVIDTTSRVPPRIICIAIDESDHAKHGIPISSFNKAVQWATDNLLDPDTDQVVLLNARLFVHLFSHLKEDRVNIGYKVESEALIMKVSHYTSDLLVCSRAQGERGSSSWIYADRRP